MAHVELAALEHLAHQARQLEEPQQVRDRRARAADGVGGVGMREPELLDEPVQRARLLERVQVLALNVLDQRDRDGGLVGNVADDGRDRLQARHLRGPPAALAGHDLVFRLAARRRSAAAARRSAARRPAALIDSASSVSESSRMSTRG